MHFFYSKAVSATTPVISKEREHSETILSSGDLDATKKSTLKVSSKRGSCTKYSDAEWLKIGKYFVKTALLWAYKNLRNHFQT